MSIVRIGLAETKKFSEGYAAIFGDRKKKDAAAPSSKKKDGKKAKAGKKKSKK